MSGCTRDGARRKHWERLFVEKSLEIIALFVVEFGPLTDADPRLREFMVHDCVVHLVLPLH